MNTNRLAGMAFLVTTLVFWLASHAHAQAQPDLVKLQNQMGQVQSALPQLRADLDRASAELKLQQAVTAHAQQAFDATKSIVDQMHSVALAQFLASPAYLAALADLHHAQAALETAHASALSALACTDDYRRAQQAVTAAQQRLGTLRDRLGPGGAPVTAASQAWMDALNQLERLKRQALDADPGVQNAPREMAVRQAALDQMRLDFEKQLLARPDYAAALAALDLQRTSLDAATADQRRAQAALSGLQSTYDQQSAWLAQANATLQAWQAQTSLLQANLAAAPGDMPYGIWPWQPIWCFTGYWPSADRGGEGKWNHDRDHDRKAPAPSGGDNEVKVVVTPHVAPTAVPMTAGRTQVGGNTQ